MQVCNALTRQKKEEIVADLKEKLQDSVIVFGMRFKGLNVSDLMRRNRVIPPLALCASLERGRSQPWTDMSAAAAVVHASRRWCSTQFAREVAA